MLSFRQLSSGLIFSLFAVLPLRAQMTAEQFHKCVLSRAQEHGGSDWVKTVENVFQDAHALQVDQLHMATAREMNATLDDFPAPSISKTKGPDGVETTTLVMGLTKFDPMKWLEPDRKRAAVKQKCTQYFQDLSDFCVDAYFKKEDNINGWLASQKDRINEMVRRMTDNPKIKPEEVLGGTKFSVDSVTMGNMMVANKAFLPPIEIDPESFATGLRQMVVGKSGAPVGMVMDITVDGKIEHYFAPLAASGTMINPYYFVFGGISSAAWNGHWEQKYGELKVNGQSLSSL